MTLTGRWCNVTPQDLACSFFCWGQNPIFLSQWGRLRPGVTPIILNSVPVMRVATCKRYASVSVNCRRWSLPIAMCSNTFGAVCTLSDDSPVDSPKPKARNRNKRKRVPLDQSVSDDGNVRKMLGRPKCGCKQGCLRQFTEDASFSELLSFRQEWSAMHKLNQDNVDFWV